MKVLNPSVLDFDLEQFNKQWFDFLTCLEQHPCHKLFDEFGNCHHQTLGIDIGCAVIHAHQAFVDQDHFFEAVDPDVASADGENNDSDENASCSDHDSDNNDLSTLSCLPVTCSHACSILLCPNKSRFNCASQDSSSVHQDSSPVATHCMEPNPSLVPADQPHLIPFKMLDGNQPTPMVKTTTPNEK